jgi:hypothetical protein
MTIDDLNYEVNLAVLKAMDETLTRLMPTAGRTVWVMDKHLPSLLPTVEAVTARVIKDAHNH